MDANAPTVILLYDGKELDKVIICENVEEAREMMANRFKAGKRDFVATARVEYFDPEKHLETVQQGMFAKEARDGR